MAWTGFRVEEAIFFAGHLKNEEGESVYLVARKMSGDFALQAAARVMERSNLLPKLNQEWGRNSILLYLAKTIKPAMERKILLILIVDALTRDEKEEKIHLVLERPLRFDPSLVAHLRSRIQIHFGGGKIGF